MSDRICFSLPWRFPPTFGKRDSEHAVSSNVIEQTTVLKKDAQDALDQYEKAFIAKRCELRSQRDSVNIVSSNEMEKISDSQYQVTEKEKEIQELLDTLANEFRSEDNSPEYQVEQNANEKNSEDDAASNKTEPSTDDGGTVNEPSGNQVELSADERVSGEVQPASSNEKQMKKTLAEKNTKRIPPFQRKLIKGFHQEGVGG
ncbi:unnamed protein product [Orchesella dallaii]|uniref:Uncharacterized protein n=1 Tax=Orchesella dallaii TaxID=48710 RepID=A0ABP1RMW6_9HEXA